MTTRAERGMTTTLTWDDITLAKGNHNGTVDCGNPELCFFEALNLVREQKITDSCPADVSMTLHGFLIGLNDALPNSDRQRLKDYRDRIVGTAEQPRADKRAAYLCVDWLIRTYTPAFLRLAGLDSHADNIASAPEVTDLVTLGGVTDHVSAARSAADSAAYSAADSAAYSAAEAKLMPTVRALQSSAFTLLDAMIDCYTVEVA